MSYCVGCSGTGKYKKPKDEEKFDRLFDYYDRPGTLSLEQCYNNAINEVGYTIIPCSCEKGKEYADKLSKGME